MLIKSFNDIVFSEGLEYHILNNLPLYKNIYRYGSEKFCDLLCEVRKLYQKDQIDLDIDELFWIKGNTGRRIYYKNKEFILELPLVEKIENDIVKLKIYEINYDTKKINKIVLYEDKNNIFKNEHPYNDIFRNDKKIIREFDNNIDIDDLKWHFDNEDRIIKLKEETDWKIQFDNQLPKKIVDGLYIPKNIYHRLIIGNKKLNLEIEIT